MRLCGDGVRLLVEVPFTAADAPALSRLTQLWASFLPCTRHSIAQVAGLLYLFNGVCQHGNPEHACALIQQQPLPAAVRRCFGEVHVRDAQLTGRSDVYDKHRRSARWSAGPNNLFYRAVAIARHLKYTHMLQMEADVIPFRFGWLTRAICIAGMSDAWVIGSALRANCSLDEATGACVAELPEEIAEHINGNAIYAIGDVAFGSYLQRTRTGTLGRMPYDLALHVARSRYSQPDRRQLLHRFQHSSFVLNYGTAMPERGAVLRSQSPISYLLHSSALNRLTAAELLDHFEPSAPKSAGNDSASASRRRLGRHPSLDLSLLRERASKIGAWRAVMITFVAGVRYRDLCLNHLNHLHRAQVRNHVLVALDVSSLQWLQGSGEPVVDATQLVTGIPIGGSDAFGSAAFFAINGARYRAMLAMLEEGLSVFVLDLDVVVRRNPMPWLAKFISTGFELLVQSDARDGIHALEFDPDLVQRRLGLRGAYNWTYVNGGTFFCASSPSTIGLFRRIWSRLSASTVPPNEQDVLNSELAAAGTSGALKWTILPPESFPNGFVYFVRPVPGVEEALLVHANWINGVEEKIYHLREAGLWTPGRDAQQRTRLLSVGDGVDHGSAGCQGFAAHHLALRDAVAVACLLNRTLVIPRLPISRKCERGVVSRSLSHFYDYRRFADALPQHQERGPSAWPPQHLENQATRIHLDVGRHDPPPAGQGYQTVRAVRAAGVAGLSDTALREKLQPWANAPILHLWTAYRRVAGRITKGGERSGLVARAGHALRAAPRLQGLAQHLHRSMRKQVGTFDCVNIAAADREYASTCTSLAQQGVHVTTQQVIVTAANALNRSGSSRPVLVVIGDANATEEQELRRHVAHALGRRRAVWMDDYVPRWYLTDVDTPGETHTFARSVVELKLCSRAKRFMGNCAASSTRVICEARALLGHNKPPLLDGKHGDSDTCADVFGRTVSRKRRDRASAGPHGT